METTTHDNGVEPSRIAENIDVFDFDLSADEMTAIDGLDTGRRGGPSPRRSRSTRSDARSPRPEQQVGDGQHRPIASLGVARVGPVGGTVSPLASFRSGAPERGQPCMKPPASTGID